MSTHLTKSFIPNSILLKGASNMEKVVGSLVLILFYCAPLAAEETTENTSVASNSNAERSVVADVAFVCGTWKRSPFSPATGDDAATFAKLVDECDSPDDLAGYCVVALSKEKAEHLQTLSGAARFTFLKNVCTLDVLKAAATDKIAELGAVVENVERRQELLLEDQLSSSEKQYLAQLPPNEKTQWLMNYFSGVNQPAEAVSPKSSENYVDITSNLAASVGRSPVVQDTSNRPASQVGPRRNRKLGAYRALGHLFFWTGLVGGVAGGFLASEEPSIGVPVIIESGLHLILAMGFGISRQAELAKERRRLHATFVPMLGLAREQPFGLSLRAAF